MKKILSLIKISITDAFAYRGDVFLYTMAGVTQTLVTLAVWMVISGSSSFSPLTSDQFVQYYLLILVIKLWTSAWADVFIAGDIRTGRLSGYLTRPMSYLIYQFGNNLGEKIVKTIYLIPVVLILAVFTDVVFPTIGIPGYLIMFLSWLMAFGLTFFIDICSGLIGFWFSDIRSVHEGFSILNSTLSGQLIPVFLLPGIVQRLNSLLPFRYTVSLPVEIALQRVSGLSLVFGLLMQVFWLFAFVFLYKWIWKHGLRQYSAYGA